MKKKRQKALIAGKFIGNARGFGFVKPDQPDTGDIFIPWDATNGALNGDSVLCRIEPDYYSGYEDFSFAAHDMSHYRPEGSIVEIVSRPSSFVGTFYKEGRENYIVPMDPKIPYHFHVPAKMKKAFQLVNGHRVVFASPIIPSNNPNSQPGHYQESQSFSNELNIEIMEVLGHMNDPGVDVLSIVRQYGVPSEFPKEVLAEAEALPEAISESDVTGRLDLRGGLIFTIDGEDTKDIDDAVSLSMTEDGLFSLGVHIADVTHYVGEGMPLDCEALKRGTSIYPAGRVIPMLPHALSSGICSLNENEDRLTLSCLMTVNEKGEVTEHTLTPSVIRSRKRFTYDRVAELLSMTLENDRPEEGERGDSDSCWLPILRDMNRLRQILRNKRIARGALAFDLPEAKIVLDEDGRPVSINAYEHNDATGLIEEFMILCNETVAEHFHKLKTPFVYRTHQEPEPEKLSQLSAMVEGLGYRLQKRGEKQSSVHVLQKLLSQTADTPEEAIMAYAVLKSLPQAKYTPDDPKHYGLASPFYCHFTSPIRRYPDLQIHRIIKRQLWGMDSETAGHFRAILPEVCSCCSKTERTAEALEREVAQMKKAQYMRGKEGLAFNGVVSGVVPWGAYVTLEDTVEGLITIESLRYKNLWYDEKGMCFLSDRKNWRSTRRKAKKGETTSNAKRFGLRMGDKVEVVLNSVNETERKVFFTLA